MENKGNKVARGILFVFLGVLAVGWMYPIFMILTNSLKAEKYISTNTVFKLPTAESFTGLSNYVEAISSQGFAQAFGYSIIITVQMIALVNTMVIVQ